MTFRDEYEHKTGGQAKTGGTFTAPYVEWLEARAGEILGQLDATVREIEEDEDD